MKEREIMKYDEGEREKMVKKELKNPINNFSIFFDIWSLNLKSERVIKKENEFENEGSIFCYILFF